MDSAKSYEQFKKDVYPESLSKLDDMTKGEVVNHIKDMFYYEILIRESSTFFELQEEEQKAINERAIVRLNYFLDKVR